ncbi:MAG: hypothetical protein P4L85_16675 [Paludisphaera borealis]|uniref:hypothetical protein n=1 Tax=Paludisphaera borealis TaxID=1387353 RepID=UPI002841D55F|nr:hypothetical protein [Paludisphaera borealis]MDR3620989.1 hypothetical protein [Paludisphaera borealis]
MSGQTYDEDGLRFEYPHEWELEVTDQGEVRTVAVQDPDGLGFALITTDESRPDPAEVADSALDAMREEYADLESTATLETINDHAATGHDLEFYAMDMTNAAMIRCFRTPRRTVLAFGQWSDLGPDELADLVRDVIRSIVETE